MLGAILGDIVGSPYEFDHNNYKHKDFPLLSEKSHFTDDTVMTAAVAVGLIAGQGACTERTFAEVQHEMRRLGP
ncbi:MAG: ADP-ribosylglycohydrolase family protein [Faecalibacterium sp.]